MPQPGGEPPRLQALPPLPPKFMKAQLVCHIRPGTTRTYDLAQGIAVIGRERSVAIPLYFKNVSLRHARLSWDDGDYFLEDLKSGKETCLNGEVVRFRQRRKLRHLDVITLGGQCDLFFLIREPRERRTHGFVEKPTRPPGPGLISEVRVSGAGIDWRVTDPGAHLVGRLTSAALPINLRKASRRHAQICVARDRSSVEIVDLDSTNGTKLNGFPVKRRTLTDGDLLIIGGVELSVSITRERLHGRPTKGRSHAR